MNHSWDDSQPIYQQLRERTIARILAGELGEGEPLPSVRQIAIEMQINPITVSKAYQMLVDEQLVEKRRGLGMFVIAGARKRLLASEREHFLQHEWPQLLLRIQNLGIDLEQIQQLLGQDAVHKPGLTAAHSASQSAVPGTDPTTAEPTSSTHADQERS
jgi:GntR family transcriptional regulator